MAGQPARLPVCLSRPVPAPCRGPLPFSPSLLTMCAVFADRQLCRVGLFSHCILSLAVFHKADGGIFTFSFRFYAIALTNNRYIEQCISYLAPYVCGSHNTSITSSHVFKAQITPLLLQKHLALPGSSVRSPDAVKYSHRQHRDKQR